MISTFQQFLEFMMRDGVLDRFTDSGITRLLKLYEEKDLQPHTTLHAEAAKRGLIV